MKHYMKRFNARRIVLAIVVSIALLACTGAVYALSVVKLAGTITVVPASSAIKLFSNELCTNEINSLDWGNVEQNTQVDKIIYVKNISEHVVNVSCNMNVSDMWCNYGCSVVGADYYGVKTLQPAEVAAFTLSIVTSYYDGTIVAGTPLNTYDITVIFEYS